MTQPHAVAVYTKPNCQQCTATKRRLDRRGIDYTEIDITEDQDAYDYVISLGHQQAPIVVLDDGTHWSGFRLDRIDQITNTKENHA